MAYISTPSLKLLFVKTEIDNIALLPGCLQLVSSYEFSELDHDVFLKFNEKKKLCLFYLFIQILK